MFLFKKPSNDRDWSPDQAALPYADIRGNRVHVCNIRNCCYTSAEDYLVRHYDKTFDTDRLESVDFIVEPFGRWSGPAHTFVSFGFEGPDYLAISVEIRKTKGQRFSPLKGLFRQYEIMYVIGDENDLIKLRANIRQDPVYLYPVKAPRDGMKELFLSMLRRANQLRQEPEFYNTLTNTCTTNLVRHINLIAPRKIPRSWKVIFPGFSDRLAYALGLIDRSQSFARVREQHRINEVAQRFADAPDFSVRIRQRQGGRP